jgi:nascent polypeptide-associated complex subunit beta
MNRELTMFIVQFSVRENLLVVTGNPETKELKDMLPDIIKQVGPNQISALKEYLTKMGNIPEGKAGEEDEDDVPELVGNFEDASKK